MSHSFNEGVSPNSTIYFHTTMNCIPDFLYYPYVSDIFTVAPDIKLTEQVMTVFCFCIQRGGKVPLTQAELPESCIRAKYVFWTVTAPIYTRHPKCGNWSGFILTADAPEAIMI